jgi:hypothetical protein
MSEEERLQSDILRLRSELILLEKRLIQLVIEKEMKKKNPRNKVYIITYNGYVVAGFETLEEATRACKGCDESICGIRTLTLGEKSPEEVHDQCSSLF